MLKVFIVILIGIAVGVAIELVLARRQRARRVVFDEPDLPPGVGIDLYGDPPGRRWTPPHRRTSNAPESSMVFDDDGGFRILGPVEYEDVASAPRDRPADGADGETPGRGVSRSESGSEGSDLGQ